MTNIFKKSFKWIGAIIMVITALLMIYNPDRRYNLCFCTTQERFTFFARLTVQANRIMGFGLMV
jgi:hypothetical protein